MNETQKSLYDAVEELTKLQRHTERQDVVSNGRTIGTQKVTIELPSLLGQMLEAIRSSMGGSTSGASLAHERSILDDDALFKMMRIASEIRGWCVAAKLVPTGDAGDDLRAWYVYTLAHPLTVEGETYRIKRMGGWAGQIRAKIDPWREKDLPDACPVCGATDWWRDGERYYRPLIVRYKPSGPDMVQQAKAMCRACEQVWNVRELAYAIEQAEEMKHA